jgi:hypothetical protein
METTSINLGVPALVRVTRYGSEDYSRFFAKALPEAVLRYFSNSAARLRSPKAIAVLIRQGRNFEL